MATPIIMPKFEMAQETGTVARWIKHEGDLVAKGDVLLEVDTDKVTMEVESPAAGVLTNITAVPGQVVPIGQPIAMIAAPGESIPSAAAAGPARAAAKPPAAAPAATGAPAAPRATPLAERMAGAYGLDLARIAGTGPQGRITKEDVESALATPEPAAPGKVAAVPAARRLARELAVDLGQVRGSGPNGRVQSDDVRRFAASLATQTMDAPGVQIRETAMPPAGTPVAPPSAAAPVTSGGPALRRAVPLGNIRRTIAERMTQSVREAPQFTVTVDVDMSRALAIVEDLRPASGDKDAPRVTLTTFIIKACAWALSQYPAANASFDGDQVLEWDDVNVGVAVAAEQGLVVPVIRNADRLGIRDIAARLADLSSRARTGKLKLDDLQGGTFTVSNLGMFGIDRFEAILNPPQAAILAVGRVAKRAIVMADDEIRAVPMASLTLTGDHRVLDGAAGAQFLALIQRVLERPGILLG